MRVLRHCPRPKWAPHCLRLRTNRSGRLPSFAAFLSHLSPWYRSGFFGCAGDISCGATTGNRNVPRHGSNQSLGTRCSYGGRQRRFERLNSSDEDLDGRKVLLVDDDSRNIFALSSVLERHGMRVLTSTTEREAIELVDDTRSKGSETRLSSLANHCADGKSYEGRPREMPGGRRVGLSG
jgi:hypothetical protein